MIIALPTLVERIRISQASAHLYRLLTHVASGARDQYLWFGRVREISSCGLVLSEVRSQFTHATEACFSSILLSGPEVRHAFEITEMQAADTLLIESIHKHLVQSQVVFPGDQCIVCHNALDAAALRALLFHSETDHKPDVLLLQEIAERLRDVAMVLWQTLDRAGTQVAVNDSMSGELAYVKAQNIVVLRPIELEHRELGPNEWLQQWANNNDNSNSTDTTDTTDTTTSEPYQPHDNVLPIGSTFLHQYVAYTTVANVPDRGLMVVNARRHPGPPGFQFQNPDNRNNHWHVLQLISRKSIRQSIEARQVGPQRTKRAERNNLRRLQQEAWAYQHNPALFRYKEIRPIRCHISNKYSIFDGCQTLFDCALQAQNAALAFQPPPATPTTDATTTSEFVPDTSGADDASASQQDEERASKRRRTNRSPK
jgi:hypothetical protein